MKKRLRERPFARLQLSTLALDTADAILKTVFPLHKCVVESTGMVRCIKDTWADPESFEMHWLELFMHNIPFMYLTTSHVTYLHKEYGVRMHENHQYILRYLETLLIWVKP